MLSRAALDGLLTRSRVVKIACHTASTARKEARSKHPGGVDGMRRMAIRPALIQSTMPVVPARRYTPDGAWCSVWLFHVEHKRSMNRFSAPLEIEASPVSSRISWSLANTAVLSETKPNASSGSHQIAPPTIKSE